MVLKYRVVAQIFMVRLYNMVYGAMLFYMAKK